MKVKEQMAGDVAVITVSGNMMDGREAGVLHETVKRLIEDKVRKVVIDLKKVKWMNSSGLGVLMASWGSMSRENGQIKLANATEKVKSLLVITQLLQFFENYEGVDEAVASFK